jgi:glycosyltransferase involved in cell wall biosynthesis
VKLLVFGHLSHTGFGTVTAEIGGRLVDLGLDVRVLAVNHRGEPVRGKLAGRVWPANMFGDPFGANLSAAAITGSLWPKLDPSDTWKPDAVLVISDVTGLISHIGQMSEAWQSVPIFHYCPIEGDNLQPAWRGLWKLFQPIAMSDYGARVIGEHIGRKVPRVYHGVDTDVFHPVSPSDPIVWGDKVLRTKDACKEAFGVAGRKVILRTDRNVTRKFFDVLFRSFASIAALDPDVLLVLHCATNDREGIDLTQEAGRLPWEIADRIKNTNAHDTFTGLPTQGLVALYNAADVYLSTTGGEGFGLTLAESIACGTPVVVTDWAAEREVVGEGGVLVPPLIDRYGEPVRYHSGYGMDWAMPDAKGFVEPVVELLARPSRRRALADAGREHIKRSFSWDTAAAEFQAILTAPAHEAAA